MPLKAALPGGFCMTASVTFKFSVGDVTNRLTIECFSNKMKAINLYKIIYVAQYFYVTNITIYFNLHIKGECKDG